MTPTIPPPKTDGRPAMSFCRPWWRDRYVWLFVLALAVLSGMSVHAERRIQDAPRPLPSPVRFVGKWRPEKPLYHPGQTIRYAFEYVTPDGGPVPADLSFESHTSWRDEDHNAPYEDGFFNGTISGQPHPTTERKVPLDAKPTRRLVIKGLMFCYGDQVYQPTPILSEPVAIEHFGSEQARAAAEREAER